MGIESCPDVKVLHRLLVEELEADQRARVAAHVETCKACQLQLETLTAEPAVKWFGQTTQGAGDASHHEAKVLTTTDSGVTADVPANAREPERNGAAVLDPDRWATGRFLPAATPQSTADVTGDFVPVSEATLPRSGDQGNAPEVTPGTGAARPWPAIPGYELVKKLGEGGMGVVYLARQIRLEPPGRRQDDPRGQPGPARAFLPLPDRGRGRRPAPPSQHPPDLRHRRGRRPAVHFAGAARGRIASTTAWPARLSRAGRPPS